MGLNSNGLSLDISKLSEEIHTYQEMENEARFEIGKRLKHVKENNLAHGEWTNWLDSIGFNQRTAQRYMQVYTRFHKIPEAEKLPFSKLAELLALPDDVDASKFIEEVKDDSVRSIREKVKETKGGINDKKETTILKTERSEPPKYSAFINDVTSALNNLIPEFLGDVEKGDATLSQIMVIGKESEYVQRKLLMMFGGDDIFPIDLEHAITLAEMTPDGDIEEVVGLLKTLQMHVKEVIGYRINLEGAIETKNFELFIQTVNDVIEKLKAKIEEQRSWKFDDDMFSEFRGNGNVSTAKILGVEESATPEEVKKRFRTLSKLLHPDVGGDAQLFDVVRKAYDEYIRKNKVA
ncbi:DUF3102 domain-containing protein [Oceanobacillus kimchii]|uniref:DUF3102 domain-containing protein n=1 Tax=Oceanobacillus kimchii TaxID=746691 RepID=UPI003B0267CC